MRDITWSGHIYHRELDPEGSDSLALIARRIRPNSVVLDLGTATGALGKYLTTTKHCTVYGVEGDPVQAETASPWYRRLETIDLEQHGLYEVFRDTTFDYIVCADVLEHLRYPEEILAEGVKLLDEDGKVLISVPNVGHLGVLLELLGGDFRYREEGLLDRAHVHFFTRRSLLRFLRGNGLTPLSVEPVVTRLSSTEFGNYRLEHLPPSVVHYLTTRPDAETYQFIVEAVPSESASELETVSTGDHALDAPLGDAEADFVSSIYWRLEDSPYREACQASTRGVVGRLRQRLTLDISPEKSRILGLRWDPANRPGLLNLYKLEIVNAAQESVWSWDGEAHSLESSTHHGIVFSQFGVSGGVTCLLWDVDPWVELPMPDESLERLDGGGKVVLAKLNRVGAKYRDK